MWSLWDAAALAWVLATAGLVAILVWMSVAGDVQVSEGWANAHLPRPAATTWRHTLLGDVNTRLWPPPKFFKGLAATAAECGPTYALRASYPLIAVVTDARDVEALLSRSAPHKKAVYVLNGVNLLLDPAGRRSLITAETTADPAWRAVRHATVGVLTPTAWIAAVFPSAAAGAGRAAAALADVPPGGAVDVTELALSVLMDTMSEVGFGVRLGALDAFEARLRVARGGSGGGGGGGGGKDDGDDLPRVPAEIAARAVSALLASSEEVGVYCVFPYRGILPFRLLFPSVRRGIRTFKAFQEVADAVLAAAAASPACAAAAAAVAAGGAPGRTPGAARGALYASLAAAAGGDAAFLRREAGLSLDAGAETTGQTAAFTLAALAFAPAAEAAVAAELAAAGLLRAAGGPPPRREAMRLYPATASGTFRRLTAPLDVTTRRGGATIPTGSKVWVPIWLVHRSEDNWGPDAAEFKPERWLPPAGGGGGGKARPPELRPSDGARRFYVFSYGARDCPGRYLAMALVTGLLAALLGQYKFEAGPGLSCAADLTASAEPALLLRRAGGMPLIPVPR
ncbi:MAG: cytochrome P450 [Monoraphidium minutum]|nr:MAG: cytochrome P450 [Monoraphidium minutum]